MAATQAADISFSLIVHHVWPNHVITYIPNANINPLESTLKSSFSLGIYQFKLKHLIELLNGTFDLSLKNSQIYIFFSTKVNIHFFSFVKKRGSVCIIK